MDAPNVLLVVLDCVRAKNTSLLGHRRETTPFLSAFAERATTYTQARTTASWSLPAHASLFTGVPSEGHRLRITQRLDPGQTVFDYLADEGYDTGVFTENPYLTIHPSNLHACFETVVTERPDSTDAEDPAATRNGVDGFWYADRFTEWVDGREGPWAACVNLMDAHTPYGTREAYDQWGRPLSRSVHDELPIKWEWGVYGGSIPPVVGRLLEPLYDGAIRQADAAVRRIVTELDARNELDDTLVVVTADHGDGFGEPPHVPAEPHAVMHGMGTHEELFHVPLVVKAPGQEAGRRVTSLATLAAFPDAVLAAFDGERDDTGWFVPAAGRATAYQAPPDGQTAAKAEAHTDDPERFLRPAAVVYEDGPGDTVYKRAAWGEATYNAVVRGRRSETTTERHVATHPTAVTDAVAEQSESLDVSPLADGEADMAEYETSEFEDIDLEARLESLGYL